MDRLGAIRAFKTIVEVESYTAAARQLGQSRSHLSKQIKELEDSLGVRLLHRTTKQVRPTEQGRSYYGTCARVVNELDEADRALGVMQREVRGALKLLVPKSFAVLELVPALNDFNRLYPDIEVSVYLIDQRLDLIGNGFDLAIRFGEQPDSTLMARRLGAVEFTLCATPGYLRERGTPRHPADLTGHECLRHLTAFPGSRWRFEGPDGPVSVTVHGRQAANSTLLLRESVLRGQGIGLLPRFSVRREIAAGALTPLLDAYRVVPDMPLFVVYPTGRLTARVRLFVDFLAERFADLS